MATAATGGYEAPPVHSVNAGPRPGTLGLGPDDTPFLTDPGSGNPMTSGLPFGPGPGPATTPAQADLDIVKAYMPDLQRQARMPDAPASFKALVRYLQGA